MELTVSASYDRDLVHSHIMGPNPLMLCEEVLLDAEAHGCGFSACPCDPPLVLDLGSGPCATSALAARISRGRVIAADLWGDPTENLAGARAFGAEGDVLPLRADALDLPFPHGLFDAVTCIDAYNYFGRDETYLGQRLLPFVKKGGLIYLAVCGLTFDVDELEGDLPAELAASWGREQLSYLWPRARWERLFACEAGVAVERSRDLTCSDAAWLDWVACNNPYAKSDRAAIEAGALRYLTTSEFVLRKL